MCITLYNQNPNTTLKVRFRVFPHGLWRASSSEHIVIPSKLMKRGWKYPLKHQEGGEGIPLKDSHLGAVHHIVCSFYSFTTGHVSLPSGNGKTCSVTIFPRNRFIANDRDSCCTKKMPVAVFITLQKNTTWWIGEASYTPYPASVFSYTAHPLQASWGSSIPHALYTFPNPITDLGASTTPPPLTMFESCQ